MKKSLLAMILCGLCGSAQANNIRVIDGDGFMLGDREIRIWGIDAPELSQQCRNRFGWSYPCGRHAKRFLGSVIAKNEPVCMTITRDRYGRHVSRCRVAGEDLGAIMVKSGWALDFERFSKGRYAKQQREAQKQGRGVWRSRFIQPWKWRDMEKAK